MTASGRTGLGIPSCDCVFGKPNRQASALAQGSIVLRPVRHTVPLPGDVMTAGGIGLEGHDRDLCSDTKQASTLPRLGYQTPSMQQGELDLQPDLHVLHRHSRPLLCGLEQADRSALNHHVDRLARVGAPMMISRTWYYFCTAGVSGTSHRHPRLLSSARPRHSADRVERRQHKGLNNRAENSHQPTRRLDHDRWGHLTLWSAAEQGSCGLGFLPVPHATQGC